jgi:hypothetical protein
MAQGLGHPSHWYVHRVVLVLSNNSPTSTLALLRCQSLDIGPGPCYVTLSAGYLYK